ncbi:hypothetical protein [Lacrimispora sp.]|uniref:hypothetical protein n=1 Tax=Lacrimispora sp. TaxID=2719234 RepID=UPI0029E032EF|nr:hypothetical protein [Lacrimispora sp.]
MLKKLLSVALAAIMVLGMSTSVFAAENRDVLTPIPPSSIGIQPDGAKPPSSSADIHNLSVFEYNYQVEDVGYRVYTSKWLTGASSMDVLVDNWTILESYGGTSNIVTVRVFNSSKKEVTSKKITISHGYGTATFTGLTSSAKYYVCFEVPTNSNRYSFDGNIS